jgi:hypothetical protein
MRLACFKKFFQTPHEFAEVKEEYAKFSSCSDEFDLMIMIRSMLDGPLVPNPGGQIMAKTLLF